MHLLLLYIYINMIDSDLRPLLKSAPTDVIISNRGPIEGYCQIIILSKFLDLWHIYWLGLELGHTSVTSFEVDLRKGGMAIDLRSEVQMSVT
jgi:hypothetical protein